MAKETKYRVGYQWYPDQWKGSDTFLDIDDPLLRYFYREVLDLLYTNGGVWEANRMRFEKAQRYKLSDEKWSELRNLFDLKILPSGSEIWSHSSVDKRIDMRAFTSAENGKKGGHPKEPNTPLNNLNPENENRLNRQPNQPNSTKKGTEQNETKPNVSEGLVSSNGKVNGNKSPDSAPPPLSGSSLRAGLMPIGAEINRYAKTLDKRINENSIDPEKREVAFRWFLPNPLDADLDKKLGAFFKTSSEMMQAQALRSLLGWLLYAESELRAGTRDDLVREQFDAKLKKFIKA